jgi:acyl-coenzyme A thioesterase PaaI-like protein
MSVARVLPLLTPNLFLDHTLNIKRGPDGTELMPQVGLGVGDGYIHFSVIATLGEEAAWQVIGDEHAVPCHVAIDLLRPAHVDGGLITARGHLLRAGRSVICSEATVCQNHKPLAKVTATFVHFEKRQHHEV